MQTPMDQMQTTPLNIHCPHALQTPGLHCPVVVGLSCSHIKHKHEYMGVITALLMREQLPSFMTDCPTAPPRQDIRWWIHLPFLFKIAILCHQYKQIITAESIAEFWSIESSRYLTCYWKYWRLHRHYHLHHPHHQWVYRMVQSL